MKKLLFLTVLTMLFAVNAAAQTTKSGTIDGINWTYNRDTYELTLDGSGEIPSVSASVGKSYFASDPAAYLYTENPGTRKEKDIYITDDVEKINIIGSITKLGDFCFANAELLHTVILNHHVKEIGAKAFLGCEDLNSVKNIPENIVIDQDAFIGCPNLFNSGVLILGNTLVKAYPETNNLEYEIPNNVTKINPGAFSGHGKLTKITIPASVKTIGNEVFASCSNLTTVTFNGDINSIGDRVFENCSSLNNINIPSSVTTWGKDIFSGCTCLPNDGTYQKAGDHVIVKVVATEETDYTIPGNIIYIAEDAFKDCNNMQKIYCYAEEAPTSATYQLGNSKSYILYVNDGCEDDFYTKWNVQLDRINTTEVAIGSSGYTTLTLIHSAKVPTGTKAYTATINNGSIELTQVSKLAKGVGYIIWSTNGTSGTYKFNAAGEAVGEPEPSENMMKGVLKNTTLYGNGSIYLLSLYKGVVGFRCLGNNTYNLPAGKAYLESTDPSGSVERDFLNFGGDETDIEDTKEDEIINSRNNTTYNLAGQKLNAPQKGLNIVDGKLVLL